MLGAAPKCSCYLCCTSSFSTAPGLSQAMVNVACRFAFVRVWMLEMFEIDLSQATLQHPIDSNSSFMSTSVQRPVASSSRIRGRPRKQPTVTSGRKPGPRWPQCLDKWRYSGKYILYHSEFYGSLIISNCVLRDWPGLSLVYSFQPAKLCAKYSSNWCWLK